MQIGLYNSAMAIGLRVPQAAISVRPLGAGDRDLLCRLFRRLSPESIYRRFMSPIAELADTSLDRLLDLDHLNREALALFDGDEIIGVARYSRRPETASAEIAIVVADAWQHRGLGQYLLRRLGRLAQRRGIGVFTGTALGENREIVRLARRLAPGTRAWWSGGEIELTIPLAGPNR